MSKNIKEIGKELLGKSLNSFHRKTGLTQLEENNKMQDGILNGILSQVDDAYIEKTEQSNVIHLDGSGDGVVVLDSIEGNTMVNYICMDEYYRKDSSITVEKNKIMMGTNADAIAKKIDFDVPIKDNSNYTIIFTLENADSNNGIRIGLCNKEGSTWTSSLKDVYDNGIHILKINSNLNSKYLRIHTRGMNNNITTQSVNVCNLFFIEGHNITSSVEIPPYFEGLQSSFEEKVNDDGKYEVEILSRNEDETKSNKIKVLLNEPLRAIGDYKDRLLYKDNKLVIQRNVGIKKGNKSLCTNQNNHSFSIVLSDGVAKSVWNRIENRAFVKINNVIIPEYSTFPEVSNQETLVGFYQNHTEDANLSISNGAIKPLSDDAIIEVIYQLKEPTYEEVLNEYGEPIILEGYENGTLYIDSTIVPTTTVKYTPKMESFNTLKEVYNNNVMLTNDVNDNIIPYMMEVDLMIMEKEMALPSQINIRKMEVLDMTSMQKRTQDMLERLIKGKSLTEQECKTRITTYLNAGKITDEQAEELMLLIDEVYA